MPQSFLTFVGLVTGYLHGAGLGALLLSFYPSGVVWPDFELALIAALILGPAGGIAGVAAARAGKFGLSPNDFGKESGSPQTERSGLASSSSC